KAENRGDRGRDGCRRARPRSSGSYARESVAMQLPPVRADATRGRDVRKPVRRDLEDRRRSRSRGAETGAPCHAVASVSDTANPATVAAQIRCPVRAQVEGPTRAPGLRNSVL